MKAVVIGCLGISLLAGCGGGGGGGGGDNQPPARNRTLTISGVLTNLCGQDVTDYGNFEIVLHDDQGNYLESVYLVEGKADIQTGPTANISVVDSYGGNLFIKSYLQVPVAADGSTLRVYGGWLVNGDLATEGCDCTSVDVTTTANNSPASHSAFRYYKPDGAEELGVDENVLRAQRQQICTISGQPFTGVTVLAEATSGGHIEFARLPHNAVEGISEIQVQLDEVTAPQSYNGGAARTDISLYGSDGSSAHWGSATGIVEMPQVALAGVRMAMVQSSPAQSDYADGAEISLSTSVNSIGNDLDVLTERSLPELAIGLSTRGDDLVINVPQAFGTDIQRSGAYFSNTRGNYYYQLVYSPALTTLPELELSPSLEELAESLLLDSSDPITMWLEYLNLDDVNGYPAALGLVTSATGNNQTYKLGYQSQLLTLSYSGGFSTQPRVSTLVTADRQRPRTDAITPNQPLLRRINGQQVLIQR